MLLKQEEVLGDFDPARYEIERLMASARDGTRVPISLVYRAPFTRDGSRPLLLYAYGSYGATMEPTFNSQRFSLIDRGFVYAIAHVRGGQEMGRQWYDDGKMMKKWNTFHDFIDCAEFVCRERYTSPDRLVAHGGSASGLLMGVIANERAELFRAIVADVPFVDVINTMLDASIPLTAQEWEQWGNPNLPADYAYMRSYSPYDNVRAKDYSRMLVTTGLNDSRVAYWEPAKWVAKLRALKTDRNVLLLKDEHGRRPWRRQRAVRAAEGAGVPLCVHSRSDLAQSHGAGTRIRCGHALNRRRPCRGACDVPFAVTSTGKIAVDAAAPCLHIYLGVQRCGKRDRHAA